MSLKHDIRRVSSGVLIGITGVVGIHDGSVYLQMHNLNRQEKHLTESFYSMPYYGITDAIAYSNEKRTLANRRSELEGRLWISYKPK